VGSADPMTPVGVRPRRPRLLLLGTVIVVIAAIIATVILLTKDSGPATGTVEPSAEELQRLRTEAAAAAVNLFEKQVEADAAADPSVLDGIYVPGSQLGETQKRFVDELRTAGEISETRDEIADVNVVAVNRGEATVTLPTASFRSPFATARLARSRTWPTNRPGQGSG
jgi:hypothetical protein